MTDLTDKPVREENPAPQQRVLSAGHVRAAQRRARAFQGIELSCVPLCRRARPRAARLTTRLLPNRKEKTEMWAR